VPLQTCPRETRTYFAKEAALATLRTPTCAASQQSVVCPSDQQNLSATCLKEMAATLRCGDIVANTRITHKGRKGQKPNPEDTGKTQNITKSQTEIQTNIREESCARKKTRPKLDDRLQRIKKKTIAVLPTTRRAPTTPGH